MSSISRWALLRAMSALTSVACGGGGSSEGDGPTSDGASDSIGESDSSGLPGSSSAATSGDAPDTSSTGDDGLDETSGGDTPVPGGTRLVFTSADGSSLGPTRLWYVRYDDGQIDGPHQLAGPEREGFNINEVSPDGRAVLLSGPRLALTDPASGGGLVAFQDDPIVPQPVEWSFSDHAFTADGEGLVFSAVTPDASSAALYYLPIATDEIGSPIPIAEPHPPTGVDDLLTFVLSPTGDRVAFRTDLNGDGASESYIALASPSPTGDIAPLPTAEASLGRFLPDGTGYVYVQGEPDNEELFVLPLDGLEAGIPLVVEAPPETRPVGGFRIAPDGSGIAYTGGSGSLSRLYYAPLVGTSPGASVMVGPPDVTVHSNDESDVWWSPNGDWLGFTATTVQADAYVLRVADGVPGPPTLTGKFSFFAPDDTVAWQMRTNGTADDELWRFDMTGETPGEPQLVNGPRGTLGSEVYAVFSASGRHLLISSDLDDGSLLHVDDAEAPLTAVTLLTTLGSTGGLAVTNDDRFGAFVRKPPPLDPEPDSIVLLDIEDPGEEVVLSPPGVWATDVAVLPDP